MTAPTIKTAAELEEFLGDDTRLKASLKDGTFAEVIETYANRGRDDDQAAAQIREETQRVVAEMFRDGGLTPERPDMRPTAGSGRSKSRAGDRGQMHNPHAAGAVLDGKFENVGQVFVDLARERAGDRESAGRLQSIRNEFASAVPSDGGFLVPEEFRADLMTTALEGALVRPKATVIPMGVPRVKFPTVEDTNHSGALFGGVTAYWTEERGLLVNSSPKFGSVTLDVNKLTMRTSIPNELVNDSAISVTSYVEQSFPTALRWYEDDAFISGHGVGKPLGFMNAGNTAMVTVAKESGQAADTIVRQNITKMYSRMLPTSLGSAVWLANINAFPALAELAAADNSPVWLQTLVGGPPASILGRPLIFTEKMESIGDLGDLAFVDLSYYLIGDRQQMTAMWSEHVEFDSDAIAYRLISRVDGRPWLKNPITPKKGAATLSPFVQLEAR